MFQASWSTVRGFLRDAAGSLYHIVVVTLSAGIALLLPAGARQFLSFWSWIEHGKLSLVAVEMAVAIGAGLVSSFPQRARGAERHIRKLKEERSTGRTVMIMGSSGYSTFMDQVGDLASVLDKCLGAKNSAGEPLQPGSKRASRPSLIPSTRWPPFAKKSGKALSFLSG
ncbi:MAG: hypothetical protein AB1555_16245 [Nitrospirota bacterium]